MGKRIANLGWVLEFERLQALFSYCHIALNSGSPFMKVYLIIEVSSACSIYLIRYRVKMEVFDSTVAVLLWALENVSLKPSLEIVYEAVVDGGVSSTVAIKDT